MAENTDVVTGISVSEHSKTQEEAAGDSHGVPEGLAVTAAEQAQEQPPESAHSSADSKHAGDGNQEQQEAKGAEQPASAAPEAVPSPQQEESGAHAEDVAAEAAETAVPPTAAAPAHAAAPTAAPVASAEAPAAVAVEDQEQGHGGLQHDAHHKATPAPHAAASCKRSVACTTGSIASKGLTFTGPPYVPKAKPYRRMDYSHSAVQLMKIEHDNHLLFQHLTSIGSAAPQWCGPAHTAPGNVASSAVNRRKAAGTIAQENHALYQRLVAIRPSKDISRDTLEAQHRRNEVYKANCAQYKPHQQRASSPNSRAAAAPTL